MAAVQTETLVDRAAAVLSARRLADADTPAMLMVSGGSDSTALAYIACELRERGALGQLAMLHVNHRLRGEMPTRTLASSLSWPSCWTFRCSRAR